MALCCPVILAVTRLAGREDVWWGWPNLLNTPTVLVFPAPVCMSLFPSCRTPTTLSYPRFLRHVLFVPYSSFYFIWYLNWAVSSSCLYFCLGDESKRKMERHFMLGDAKSCNLWWSQCCWDVCSGAALADCLSPPLGWPLASTMCLLVVHCPCTLLSNSLHMQCF